MTANELLAVLKKTAKIARLRKIDLAEASGYSYKTVHRWHKNDNIGLRQFVDWANCLGYEVTLRRKTHKE